MEVVNRCQNIQQIYNNRACGIKVFIGTHPQYGEVAIKIIECNSDTSFNFYQREGRIAASVKHESICRVFEEGRCDVGVVIQHYLVMEKAHSDLHREIRKRVNQSTPWTEQSIVNIMEQIVSALVYAQNQGICHRDIKPQNILIERSGRIKLADFGSANEGIDRSVVQTLTLQGTPMYLSPELRAYYGKPDASRPSKPKYNPYKSDVYSLGLTLLHMLSLKPPVELSRLDDLEQATSFKIEEQAVSETFKEILRSMLTRNEELRPDFIQLQEIVISIIYGSIRNQPSLKVLKENYIRDENDPPDVPIESLKADPHVMLGDLLFSPVTSIKQPDAQKEVYRFDFDEPIGNSESIKSRESVGVGKLSQAEMERMSREKPSAPPMPSIGLISLNLPPQSDTGLMNYSPSSISGVKLQIAPESIHVATVRNEASVRCEAPAGFEPPAIFGTPAGIPISNLPPSEDAGDYRFLRDGECAHCFTETDSAAIELSCGHLICSANCLQLLVEQMTKFFRHGFECVTCPACRAPISKQMIQQSVLSGQTLRTYARSRKEENMCLECRSRPAEITLSCSHSFCLQSVRGWRKLAIRRRVWSFSCPFCGEGLSDDDLNLIAGIFEN